MKIPCEEGSAACFPCCFSIIGSIAVSMYRDQESQSVPKPLFPELGIAASSPQAIRAVSSSPLPALRSP
jgi:hypothetical protein